MNGKQALRTWYAILSFTCHRKIFFFAEVGRNAFEVNAVYASVECLF